MRDFRLKFSFDDGSRHDLRTAELLEQRGFRATFFVPSNCELAPHEIKRLAERHAIGGHTVSHPQDLKLLSDGELDYQIGANRAWLQELTGQAVEEFCYPRGRYDDRVIAAVKRAGYATARTTLIGWHFREPPEPYRQHTTVHTYDRKEYGGERWQDYARRMLKKSLHAAKRDVGYYHLWGHSWLELERNGWWGDFDALLADIEGYTRKYEPH